MLEKLDQFSFNHSDQIDRLYEVMTTDTMKAAFDSRAEELKTTLNKLIDDLQAEVGASNIGMTPIAQLGTQNKVKDIINRIVEILKSTSDGYSGADFISATSIAGLEGVTVQALLESLKKFIDDYKIELSSNTGANKVKTTSGKTVQEELDNKMTQGGDFLGSWHGITNPAYSDPGIASVVSQHTEQLAQHTEQLSQHTSQLAEKANKDGTLQINLNAEKLNGKTASATPLTTNKTDIIGMVNELFTNANNLKSDWAGVIGSPLLSTDTSAQLKSKTQTIKNTMATNLTAKGQSSVGTESLATLASKIGQIKELWSPDTFVGFIANISKNLCIAVNKKDNLAWVSDTSNMNKVLGYNSAGTLIATVNFTQTTLVSNVGDVSDNYILWGTTSSSQNYLTNKQGTFIKNIGNYVNGLSAISEESDMIYVSTGTSLYKYKLSDGTNLGYDYIDRTRIIMLIPTKNGCFVLRDSTDLYDEIDLYFSYANANPCIKLGGWDAYYTKNNMCNILKHILN